MTIALYILISAVAIAAVFLFLKLLKSQSDVTSHSNRSIELQTLNTALEATKAELAERLKQLETENASLKEKIHNIDVEKTFIDAQKKSLEEKIAEQQRFITESQKIMKEQFENLANKQLEDNNKKFFENSSLNLSQILKPLSENIETFKKEFSETYMKESRERFSLGKEIEKMAEASGRLNMNAENLTKALKGDRKMQGNWGEMILERLLEDAGLKKDIHYKTQENFTDEQGRRQLPDVIINTSDDKYIIVDSKVSLVSYERYFAEELDDQRALHARNFVESVKAHIKGLSGKAYQDNKNLNTLDFVIMFMPIEGTFQMLSQYAPDIFTYGWANRVVITSPATLYPILKTISSIWKVEAQNRNTQEIIRTATSLYDKFINFAEDLESIGKNIERAQNSYRDSVSKLKDGKGNAISIIKKLEDFGIEKKKTGKKLPSIMQPEEEEEAVLIEGSKIAGSN